MEQVHSTENNNTSRAYSRWQNLAIRNVEIRQQVQSRLQHIAYEQRMIDTLRCLLTTLCMPRDKNCLTLIKTRQNVNKINKLNNVPIELQVQGHEQQQEKECEESSHRINWNEKINSNNSGSTDRLHSKVKPTEHLTSSSTNTITSSFWRIVAYFKWHEPNNERIHSAICDPFRQAGAFTHSKTAFVSYCDLPCSNSALSLRHFFQCFPPISKHMCSIKRKRSPDDNSDEQEHINIENNNDTSTNNNRIVKDTGNGTMTPNDEHFSANKSISTTLLDTSRSTYSISESNIKVLYHQHQHHHHYNTTYDDSNNVNSTLTWDSNNNNSNNTVQNLQTLLRKHNWHESNNTNHFTEWREFVHTNTEATKIVALHFTDIHALLARLLVCYATHLLIQTPEECLEEKLCSLYSLQNHHILKYQLELMTFAHVRNCDDVDLVSNSRIMMYKKLQLISLHSDLQENSSEPTYSSINFDNANIAREVHDNVSDAADDGDNNSNEDTKNAQFASQASHTLLACYLACKSGVFVSSRMEQSHRDTSSNYVNKGRINTRSDQSRLKPHETIALLLNSHAAVDVRKINLMKVEDVLS